MITKEKTVALCMFAHSRLANKMLEVTARDSGKMIHNKEESDFIEEEIGKYVKKLESRHLTIDQLNSMPDNMPSKMLTYYYEVCLKTMNKYLKKGDEVVESIIGLSIVSYLEDERELVGSDFDAPLLITKFEKLSIDRKLNYHMLKIGAEIVEAVERCSYISWARKQRKNNKRLKKRAS